jgi:hypothetical protein
MFLSFRVSSAVLSLQEEPNFFWAKCLLAKTTEQEYDYNKLKWWEGWKVPMNLAEML